MRSKPKKGRKVDGILLLDKPPSWTSNEALQQVKRLYRAAKAGHTGSLDPLATGLLPICLGNATKFSAYLLDADKHYQMRIRLGETTTTGDAEGELLETAPTEGIDAARVQAVLSQFQGEIEQLPPMYSALKHQGKRLYQLARQGIEVDRKPRKVTIHAIQLTAFALPECEFQVHCSKGTYIRTLAEDLGKALGCGAHVIGLRRTGVGPYREPEYAFIPLDRLKQQAAEDPAGLDALLLPLESALAHRPAVQLTEDAAFYLLQGQAVLVPQSPTEGLVRLYDPSNLFLGIGCILDDGRVQPKRLLPSGA